MKTVGSIYTNIRQNRLWDKYIIRDKEGHTLIMRGSVHQKDATIIHTYTQRPKLHEAKTDTAKERIRQLNKSLRCLTFTNWQNN